MDSAKTATPATPPARPARPAAPAAPELFAGWSDAEVDLIRRTIAPLADDYELALYLRLCRHYGLDPFRRELVLQFRDMGGRRIPVFIATRDAYLRAAMRDPGYAGIMSGVVCKGDHFEFDVERQTIVHRFGVERGAILGAWAIARHASRPPVMVFVPFAEYNDPSSPTWRKFPTAMIQKVAEVAALRRQYGITGIVAREEVEHEFPSGDTPGDELPQDPRPARPSATAPAIAAPQDAPDAPAADSGAPRDTAAEPPIPQDAHAPGNAHESAPNGNGTAPDPTPASAEKPEPDPSLVGLVIRAARADGYSGPRFAARWLMDRHGVPSLDAIDPETAERVRADALRACAAGSPAPSPGSPREALRRAFDRDGEAPERRAAIIREWTGGRAQSIDALSDAEAQALLDARWPELRAARTA